MAIYACDDAPPDANILIAQKKAGLKDLEKQGGPVKWYRYWEDD